MNVKNNKLSLSSLYVKKIIFFTIILISGITIYVCTKGYVTLKSTYWWPPEEINALGIKVKNPKQLPENCNHWEDKCWKDAVADGEVKFIDSTAVDSTGRKIVFAYFINTSTAFGVTGLYNYLPFYADDGSAAAADIFGGGSIPVDWVTGTKDGIIFHEEPTNSCFELYYSIIQRNWSSRSAPCPQ